MSSNLKKGALSSVLLVGESILKKLVGLVSTLILARVLLPEDFGIIAIATLMIGFIQILSETGSMQYLLKVDTLDEEKTNTSFTINLILKGSIAVALALSASLVASFYGDPRLTPIILSLTGIFVLNSLRNPGIAFLRREQNYVNIVKMSIFAKIISVGVAITAALTLQNYWALVLGQLTNSSLMLVGTYIVHPHRPKLTLKNAKEQWQFSGWIIPQSIFGYARTQLDTFLVSATFGQSELGSYHTMKYIAYIPSAHIILPVIQPFLVEQRKTKNAPSYFAKQFNATFLITMLIALPITCVMFFHHQTVTAVLLGPNWIKYSALLGVFSLLIPSFVLLNQCTRILIIFGKTKHIFIYECIAFSIIYSMLFGVGLNDIETFTFIRVAMEALVTLGFLFYVSIKYTGVKSCISLFASFFPLSLSCIVAVWTSFIVEGYVDQIFLKLVMISVACFTTFYISMLLFHVFGFNKLPEWKYLEGIILRIATPVFARFKRPKKIE